jgi:hypothetical protein
MAGEERLEIHELAVVESLDELPEGMQSVGGIRVGLGHSGRWFLAGWRERSSARRAALATYHPSCSDSCPDHVMPP